ncbi:MAG: molecular chaperone DjlA [Pelagibacteraceae bacterium]|nr:molecular chaperone DjlA [Pelagibacteraceae bacterium]|tara:strand:+ start:377 stop:1111 length:735 start_codon:yes stop_codon:yes gene_type:complete
MSIWGKIIGGTAGFALGGPIGAIIGAMAGHSFDKRRQGSKSNFYDSSNINNQNAFALGIIILSAKLAKADGVVTKDEINAFKEKFRIPQNEMKLVGKIFNEAKKSAYGFESCAKQIKVMFSNNRIVLEELLNNLFYIAEADGKISKSELDFLKTVSLIFEFDQKTFERILESRQKIENMDPYKVLGVNREDSDDDIRKAWINLTKSHHPDQLVAKGLPPEFIDQANKEMSSINAAYDKIQKMRT